MTVKKNKTLSRRLSNLRRRIRNKAGASVQNCPIILANNPNLPPTVQGEHGKFVTKTGKIVTYPQAYRRAGGNCYYEHSTYRVEVGMEWIKQHATKRELVTIILYKVLVD